MIVSETATRVILLIISIVLFVITLKGLGGSIGKSIGGGCHQAIITIMVKPVIVVFLFLLAISDNVSGVQAAFQFVVDHPIGCINTILIGGAIIVIFAFDL